MLGRALHTLIGYSDRPTEMQLVVYVACWRDVQLDEAVRAGSQGSSRALTCGICSLATHCKCVMCGTRPYARRFSLHVTPKEKKNDPQNDIAFRCVRACAVRGCGLCGASYGRIGVNVRSGPGTQYQVIGTIPGGATVDVGGCSANWCQVSFNGETGYASQSYLSVAEGRPAIVAPSYAYDDTPYYDDYYDDGYGYGAGVGLYVNPGHRFQHGWNGGHRGWNAGHPGWNGGHASNGGGRWQGRTGWNGNPGGNRSNVGGGMNRSQYRRASVHERAGRHADRRRWRCVPRRCRCGRWHACRWRRNRRRRPYGWRRPYRWRRHWRRWGRRTGPALSLVSAIQEMRTGGLVPPVFVCATCCRTRA